MTTDNTTQQTTATATQKTQETAGATGTTTQPVTLHVNDIVNGTILLKVAIERSAFKAEEIAEVGAVYTKLNAFVQYLQAVAQAEKQSTEATANASVAA